ncbi:MAG: SLC13 family permease [Steroidobacteraceae bacterium]
MNRDPLSAASAPPSDVQHPHLQSTSFLKVAGRILCVLVPAAIWLSPLQVAPQTKHMFAVLAFMLIAWMTQATEFAVTGLIGCFLFWALGIVPFNVAFSGFTSQPAWFSFAALLMGLLARESGLAHRLAYTVIQRIGTSYSRILLGLLITNYLLTFVVPSGLARIVIMASVALAVADAFQAQRGSNIACGMFVVLTYTADLFDKMMLAGTASITSAGLMQRLGDIRVLWGEWLFAFLPCSIVTVFVAWWLALRLFPAERTALAPDRAYFQHELEKMGRLSATERRAAILMGCAVVLWMTGSLTHIPPTMVALGVGLSALLPYVGVLDAGALRRLNYSSMLFVAAAISMGSVLEATNGLSMLATAVFRWIQPVLTNVFSITAVLYWTAFLYHFLLGSEISMLATSIPLVLEYAKTHGLNPLQLSLIWTFAAGGKLFAYQSAVLVVGYSYGYFEARDLIKMGAWMTLIEFVFVMLLVPFYWPLIGIH